VDMQSKVAFAVCVVPSGPDSRATVLENRDSAYFDTKVGFRIHGSYLLA